VAVAVSQGVAFAAIGAVGLLLATRVPLNAIGWLYLAAWMVLALGVFAEEYGRWATVVHADGFAGTFTVWLTNWLFVPALGLLLTYPLLLFPDGHLPSPRWRWVGWATGVVTVSWCIAFAYSGADYADAAGRDALNPYTPQRLVGLFDLGKIALAILFISLVGCSVASLVVRFRRSGPLERAQIKWLMLAGAAAATFLALPVDHGTGNWVDVLLGFVLALLPISVGVAILRYRLYDIDRIISRTASYALVTGLLLAVYFVIVTSVTTLLPQSTNAFAVAAATLTAAAAFRPLLDRVQKAVDRRFDRARYDGQRTVDVFAARLRDEVDAERVSDDLLTLVRDTVQPTGVGLWLRGGPS
jgi:hypothetical protein